jgi:hypothetical protein
MRVYAIATDLLELAADTLADPPDRRYVSIGDPAWDDCPQLVAAIRAPQTSRGLETITPNVVCIVVPVWTVCVELVRCIPVPDANGNPPSSIDLSASAQAVSIEFEDLFYGFVEAALDGTLLEEGCSLASLVAEIVPASGGMIGVRVCVSFETSRPTGSGS